MNRIPPFSYPVTFLTIFLNIYGTITLVKANVENPSSAVRSGSTLPQILIPRSQACRMLTNYLSRVRRNHGLEHATLHVLSQRFPQTPMAGHSDSRGFWILGNLSQEAVVDGAHSALQRLQAGQKQLAIHPNCGTNFATAGIFAGLSAWLALAGAGNRWRDRLERLPLAMTLATLALVLSHPLGKLVQERVTTSGNPGSLELVEARFAQRGSVRACRFTTRDRV